MMQGEVEAVTEIDFTPAMKQIMKPIERRGHVLNVVLAALLIIIIVWASWASWRDRSQPKIVSIDISNVQIVGPTALCPGDRLTVLYQLAVDGQGTLMWDNGVYRGNQPAEFSDTKRLYVEGPATLDLHDVWQVPEFPDSANSSLPAWLPGQYRRYIAISASSTFTSRYTSPARLVAPFSIRATCPK